MQALYLHTSSFFSWPFQFTKSKFWGERRKRRKKKNLFYAQKWREEIERKRKKGRKKAPLYYFVEKCIDLLQGEQELLFPDFHFRLFPPYQRTKNGTMAGKGRF